MSGDYKPPTGPPPSAGVFAKYVLAYARLPIADARAGMARIREFVDRILTSAKAIDGSW